MMDIVAELTLMTWFLAVCLLFLFAWVIRSLHTLAKMTEEVRRLNAEVAELNARLNSKE